MSDRCKICPNCEGCENGNVSCQDPKCQPNCQDCQPPPNYDATVAFCIFMILMCLVGILIIYVVAYGPKIMFKNEDN